MLLTLCFGKSKLCSELHKERTQRHSPKTKRKECQSETNSVWAREELQSFIRHGRLCISTAYKSYIYWHLFCICKVICLNKHVEESVLWSKSLYHGCFCSFFFFFSFFLLIKEEDMTDDCELNVTQWAVSDRYALRALVLVQMSLLHSSILPSAAYSP